MIDKDFDIKKVMKNNPNFEDLSLEEQWSLMYFMNSTVEDPEMREVSKFLIKKLKELEQKFKKIEKNSEIKQLIRIKPLRPPGRRLKIVTSRFSEEEKEEIDKIVEEYNTTLTELVRNAVFHYINFLKKNKEV